MAKRHRDILSLNQSNPPRRVILGNSITHFWGGEPKGPSVRGLETWEKIMRPAGFHNLGYGFDRIENVLWRVYHGELDGYKAEEVVLMIGTNNIGINNDNEIVEGIRFLAFRHQATAAGGQDQGNRHLAPPQPRRTGKESQSPHPSNGRDRMVHVQEPGYEVASGRRQDKRILILRRITPERGRL